MKKEKLHFYLLRLRNSSLRESIYRTNQLYFLKKLKKQVGRNRDPVTGHKIDYKDVIDLRLPPFPGYANKDLIQGILNGELFSLNTDVTSIRKFEKKHSNIFFADINYSERHPDIRTVLEPARLQHLVILLRYISQTKESPNLKVAKQFVKNSVLDWIRKNPFLMGPHYISAMECGLRIPVFFYCVKILDNLDVSEYQLILDTIYRHGWWVSKRLSLYSSLGNHTVAECVGLIFSGTVFRNTQEGRDWQEMGKELLKQEVDHQVLGDGGPAEQSLHYHRFVLDLYWLAIDFLETNDLHDCDYLKERLRKAECFLTAIEDGHGGVPSIGDSDDGYAIVPAFSPRRIIPDKRRKRLQTFSTSGYTVIHCNDSMFVFDHGPLGMAPFYNHGHADALSITLSVGGKEILVDPGTYRYHGEGGFRKYFKGTRAHNTVTIDGLDQAVQETGFIWSHPYKTKVVRSVEIKGGFFLQAVHDGYMRIKKPVRHVRSIVNLDGTNFIVKDSFLGKGVHAFELNYHVHPDWALTLEDDGWWKIGNQGAEIHIRLLDENTFKFVKGQDDPPFGWYSPAYGMKRESGVLSCKMTGFPQKVSFITAICMSLPQEIGTLSQRLFEIEQQIENS